MIVSYFGTEKDLHKLTDNELVELLNTPSLNTVSKTQINRELLKRLP